MAPHAPQPDPAHRLAQLKVTLEGISPPIWRRLLVPADIALPQLHAVLQTAMGWDDCHQHCFRHEGATYQPKAPRSLGGLFAPRDKDEAKFRLVDLLGEEGDRLIYEYDFGDGWEHEVRVEKVAPVGLGGSRRPICLEGRRACPPDDCGGIPGYAHLLEVMANRKHPEYRELLDWLGERFDPEAFNAAKIDQALLQLKL